MDSLTLFKNAKQHQKIKARLQQLEQQNKDLIFQNNTQKNALKKLTPQAYLHKNRNPPSRALQFKLL